MTRKKKNPAIEKEPGVGDQTPLSPAPSTMDELSASEELPEVQQHSIDAIAAEKGEKLEAAKRDGFDPDIHATNDDGSPKKTQAGNFAKKRGRKSTLNTGEKSAKAIEKEEAAEKAAEKAKAENRQSAVVISGILEQAQMKYISEEFRYKDNERAANQAVWEATLEYYGGVNIPPPVALALDHMTIILSRAQRPQVQDKFAHVKTWFKNKFKGKKDALSHNRPDTERENNVREEESPQHTETGL